jgi:hypothetical protein
MVIFFWALCGLFASSIAADKGHNGCMWFIGGILFGPIALLAAVGLNDIKSQRTQNELLEETRKQNAWLRKRVRDEEEERRYLEAERYWKRRQLPPQAYYEDDAGEEYEDKYEEDYINVELSETEEDAVGNYDKTADEDLDIPKT